MSKENYLLKIKSLFPFTQNKSNYDEERIDDIYFYFVENSPQSIEKIYCCCKLDFKKHKKSFLRLMKNLKTPQLLGRNENVIILYKLYVYLLSIKNGLSDINLTGKILFLKDEKGSLFNNFINNLHQCLFKEKSLHSHNKSNSRQNNIFSISSPYIKRESSNLSESHFAKKYIIPKIENSNSLPNLPHSNESNIKLNKKKNESNELTRKKKNSLLIKSKINNESESESESEGVLENLMNDYENNEELEEEGYYFF